MHEGDATDLGSDRGAQALTTAPGRTAAVWGGALIGGLLVFLAGSILVTPVVGLVGWIAFAGVVIWQGRRGPMRRRSRRRR